MYNFLAIDVMQIVFPTVVLVGIAVVFAVLLAFLGKVLSVERDVKIDEVRALLPGSNCGGCGSAGCDNFAETLVKGDAPITACTQINKDNVKKIGEILGVEAEGAEPTVAVVRCNGGNACKDKYTYLGYGNCIANELVSGGTKACAWGCIGMATCSKLCNYGAIEVNGDGVSVVNPDKCVSCGLCIKECPKGIITRVPRSAKIYVACMNHDKGKAVMSVCANGCISCGICAKVCEFGAITMVDNLPVVDYSKCTGCYKCVEKCPKNVIHKREVK